MQKPNGEELELSRLVHLDSEVAAGADASIHR